VTNVLDFLAYLTSSSRSYSTVNIARSTLVNTFPLLNLSSDPLIQRLLKSASLLYPSQPRYSDTFNLQLVLDFISSNLTSPLTLEQLTIKTAFLLASSAIMRSSDLARISFSSISFQDSSASFTVIGPKEASLLEPNRLVKIACTSPSSSCAACSLKRYIERTRPQRAFVHDRLFLSLSKNSAASSQTIARWLTSVLALAGVDTSLYKAHSVRSAAATLQLKQGQTVEQVMKLGHWKSRSTFSKHYDRASTSSS
jgi:hypothetical protein